VIRLTKLNRSLIAINADLIKFIENSPDTVITLITGEKVIVCEQVDEIIAKVVEFRRSVRPERPVHPELVRGELMQDCSNLLQNHLES